MTAKTDGLTPVLDIGGTHVTAALVDLAVGQIVPGTTTRRRLDGAAPARALLDLIIGCANAVDAQVGATWV